MKSLEKPSKTIPVCEPFLDGNELNYVLDAVKTSWISSSGKYLNQFQEQFARYLGVKHGVGATNGTAALHLALVSAGIRTGHEVIIPDFTMIAPAFAICYTGARPVFVDVDPDSWTINVKNIEEKITDKTKAILPVHIYGHPVDMDPIKKLAKKYDLLVVEDAAEAHGAEYKGKKCGSLSDIAAFSFYANKNITTGEGGMVVTDNDEFADRARYYRNLCFDPSGLRNYLHQDIGFNYRLSNLQAALGVAQLEKIEEYVDRRRKNAELYTDLLKGVPELQLPIEKRWAKNCFWMYGVVLKVKSRLDRKDLMRALLADGIETRPFFTPLHSQPSLRNFGADCSGTYPTTQYLSQYGFYLPSASNLSASEIEYICYCIKKRLH